MTDQSAADDIAEIAELERLAELRAQEEIAAMVARMEAMDRPDIPPPRGPSPYRPAASTIDAFWYLVGLRDQERFRDWLADHPYDAPFLLKLLEAK